MYRPETFEVIFTEGFYKGFTIAISKGLNNTASFLYANEYAKIYSEGYIRGCIKILETKINSPEPKNKSNSKKNKNNNDYYSFIYDKSYNTSSNNGEERDNRPKSKSAKKRKIYF